jgi:hypothetical protein
MADQFGPTAFRCAACEGDPEWRLSRRGRAAVAWACSDHVGVVADDLLVGDHTHLRLTRSDTPDPDRER